MRPVAALKFEVYQPLAGTKFEIAPSRFSDRIEIPSPLTGEVYPPLAAPEATRGKGGGGFRVSPSPLSPPAEGGENSCRTAPFLLRPSLLCALLQMSSELLAHRRQNLVRKVCFPARAESLIQRRREDRRGNSLIDRRLGGPAPLA
jgi:hypothetical protein